MDKLDEILTAAESIGATDVHLVEGEVPVFRVSRTCIKLPDHLKQEVVENWSEIKGRMWRLCANAGGYGVNEFEGGGSGGVEFGFKHASAEWKDWRLRVVFYKTNGREAFSLRLQAKKIPPLGKLGFNAGVLDAMKDVEPGLVLISGGACTGKTTTLHALIGWLNSSHAFHIRTLESPIEYVHGAEQSLVTQQNVGVDTQGYYEAVEDALVQDVNVVAFGEIKDLTCLKAALKAANLNLLVIATIHAPSVGWTLARVIDEFPEADRREAVLSLSRCLKLVVHQDLHVVRDSKPTYSDHKITLGARLSYRAARFTAENHLKVLISPEKALELDQKFEFKPLANGLYESTGRG